jgi:single-stranded-DNA-specific exonuclease
MGADGRHLSLRLEQHGSSVRAVAFGKADWAKELEKPDACFDFAFRPQINEFRGHRSVQLHLVDFRPTGSDVESEAGQTVATGAQ